MASRGGGRDELSRTLRELREAANLSTRDVSKVTGFSPAKISRIERGINIPTEDDVAALVRASQGPGDVRARLVSMAANIQGERRLVVMARGKGNPAAFQERLLRIEASTEHLTTFTPTVVPGLLQTEAYLRELIAYRGLPDEKVEAFIAGRLNRQRLLENPTHRFTLITTTGALGWRAGTTEQMTEQVEHITRQSQRANVRIGIIPWGTRADVFPLVGWDLHDRRLVVYGTPDSTTILTEPRDLERYLFLTDAVERLAVFGDEARAELRRIADEYRRGGN